MTENILRFGVGTLNGFFFILTKAIKMILQGWV